MTSEVNGDVIEELTTALCSIINNANHTKYIIWTVILAAITITLPFIRDIYLAQQYGFSATPSDEIYQSKIYIFVMAAIQDIAAAMWIIYLAKAHEVNRVLWGVFGLIFGLIGVVLFYLISIHENQKHNKSLKQTD